MKLELGYGHSSQIVDIPDSCPCELLLPNTIEKSLAPEQELERALSAPIGTANLEELARSKHNVAIIVSDITRPCPTDVMLPPLLERLQAAGVKREEVSVVFALGSHRRHTALEREKLLGKQLATELRCYDSCDCGYTHMGVTARGTPVDISKPVADADMRICLGNIEFHYFAGYSGGAKAIMPGVSTCEAISKNHSLMTHTNAAAGVIENNPIREDIEEAGRICGIDFILNCVLDEHKQIVKAVAGDAVFAHRKGCEFLDRLYKISIKRRSKIVLCSQGGAPKDINLYQTQKALDNAKHAIADGGSIILLGECPQGLGNTVFEEWMLSASSPSQLTERIRREFVLGGHKAAAIALVLERANISLVSSLEPELVQKMFMQPFSSAQAALNAALEMHGYDTEIIVMPYAGSTLPVLQ